MRHTVPTASRPLPSWSLFPNEDSNVVYFLIRLRTELAGAKHMSPLVIVQEEQRDPVRVSICAFRHHLME